MQLHFNSNAAAALLFPSSYTDLVSHFSSPFYFGYFLLFFFVVFLKVLFLIPFCANFLVGFFLERQFLCACFLFFLSFFFNFVYRNNWQAC